jgi:hypothetical protein
MAFSNTLAYYVTAVKSFTVQIPGFEVCPSGRVVLTNWSFHQESNSIKHLFV